MNAVDSRSGRGASDPAGAGALATQFDDARQPLARVEEVAWYQARLPRDAGPVLDAMVGSGRLLLPLCEAGFHLHGVDLSASMLASCAARLHAAGREAPLFRQDVAALNLPFRYAAALIGGGCLQQLTSAEAVRDALASIRAHLVGPALLLLDLFVPDAALHPPGAPVVEVSTVALQDGSQIVVRRETSADPERRRIRTASRYERRVAGRIVAREDESTELTWYDEQSIVALLRDVGYVDLRLEPGADPQPAGRGFAVSARG